MLKNKKSQTGLLRFPTLAFILALIIFFLFTAPKIDDYIGGKQAAVLRSVAEGEQALGFVDASARLAAWQSLFELGEHGGFYFDTGDDERVAEDYPCDKYGYNLWNSGSRECWPSGKTINNSFKEYFDASLKSFFSQDLENRFARLDYDYNLSGKNELIIRGLTSDSVPIPVILEKKIEKEVMGPEEVVEDETITPCCEGRCVVNIAEKYAEKYGEGGVYSLPYVWGGETPYNVEQTREKTDDKNSFFYGTSVSVKQSPPHQREDTEPGFDCSGFVWWVYKHAAIPGFKNRLKAKEYEALAKEKSNNNNAQEICGSSPKCTPDTISKDAQLGDVLFLHQEEGKAASHIAIYAGNNQIIDSSSSKNGISKRALPAWWLDKHITIYRFGYNTGCEMQQEPSEQTSTEKNLLKVGALSEQYESGNRGSEVIGYDTTGKTSYGKYQIASGTGTMDVFVSFLQSKMPALYKKLSNRGDPNCEYACKPEGCYLSANREEECKPSNCYINCEFARAWKEAAEKGSLDNGIEHDFIKRTHYDPAVNGIKSECKGLYVNGRSFALQNVVWSTAVQHGARGAVRIFRESGASPDMSDEKIIKKVYAERNKLNKYFPSSSRAVKKALKARFEDEEKRALQWLRTGVEGVRVSTSTTIPYFTEKTIGHYYLNPSFATSVNYSLRVYQDLADWARVVYERCSGSEQSLSLCVKKEVDEQNKRFADFSSRKNNLGFGPDNIPFLFSIESNSYCDGEKADYYDFIEAFENCAELGHSACFCDLGSPWVSDYEFRFSNKSIALLDKTGVIEYYDLNHLEGFKKIYYDGAEYDEVLIDVKGGEFRLEFYSIDEEKNRGRVLGPVEFDKLYLVRHADGFELTASEFSKQGSASANKELQGCALEDKKHKFRFCAYSPYHVFAYEENLGVRPQPVPIKFALDLYDAPPPAISRDSEQIDKPESVLEREKENKQSISKDKECVDLGKAEIDLKVTTNDLVPNYEAFISKIASTVSPQLGMLLFAKNYLAIKDSLKALVSVRLSLGDADEDCDIAGLVYKCGVGVAPYKNNRLDFSNPTGFVDLSSRFSGDAGLSFAAPDACVLLRNPRGGFSSVKNTLVVVDKKTVSFSIDSCENPILQYKKMEGLDIITSALHGFGYYFAFAYVDSAGNYGPATIKKIEIPSVLNQLEDQLGIRNWLVLKDLLMGDYDNILGLLGLDDEWSALRSAVAGASLDRLLTTLREEALSRAYNEVADQIKDEDAKELFNDLVANGRLDSDYAGALLSRAGEELGLDEAEKLLDELELNTGVLEQAYEHIKSLDLNAKKALLEKTYEKIYDKKLDVEEMAEAEVDARLKQILSRRDQARQLLELLSPNDKLELAKRLLSEAPRHMLGAAANALDDNKKVEAVRNVLRNASDAKSDLARIITSASPDYAKKAAIDYITGNLPGFQEYKDLINIFNDFEGSTCS